MKWAGGRSSKLSIVALAVGLVFVLLFERLVLRAHLATVMPEECHTGGVALEVLERGLRFPLTAYTPELYENGIVIEGLLAIPFFVVFGPNALALKLLALSVFSVTAAAGLALVRRLGRDAGLEAPDGQRVASAAFLLFLLLAPTFYAFVSMDALGDHNEGAALSLVLFVLLFRRIERPGLPRLSALWLAAGAFAIWQKGTLLVAAIAGLHEALSALRGRAPKRWPLAAAGLFLLGYAPGLWRNITTRGGDMSTVAEKFRSPGLWPSLRAFGGEAWLFGDRNAALLALLSLGIGWYAWTIRRRARFGAPGAYLGLYLFAYLALLVANATRGGLFYFSYGYPLIGMAVAVMAGHAYVVVTRRRAGPEGPSAGLRALVAALLLGVIALAMRPNFEPDLGRVGALHDDTARASCHWRFGRAFLLAQGLDEARAAAWCRALGGERALACIDGLGYERRAAGFAGDPGERRAFAFGVGRSISRPGTDPNACAGFTDADERAACEAGNVYECLAYADLIATFLQGAHLGRPSCALDEPPYPGFSRASIADFRARASDPDDGPRSLPVPNDVCLGTLRSCYPALTLE